MTATVTDADRYVAMSFHLETDCREERQHGIDKAMEMASQRAAQEIADHREDAVTEAVRTERVRCYSLIRRYIKFDNYQQHVHSWHELQALLDLIGAGARREINQLADELEKENPHAQ